MGPPHGGPDPAVGGDRSAQTLRTTDFPGWALNGARLMEASDRADRIVIAEIDGGLKIVSVLRARDDRSPGDAQHTYELWRGPELITTCATMQDVFDHLRRHHPI